MRMISSINSIASKRLLCNSPEFRSSRENSSKLVSMLKMCFPEFCADCNCRFLLSEIFSPCHISMYPIMELSGVLMSCETDKSSLCRLSINDSVSCFSFARSSRAFCPFLRSLMMRKMIIRISTSESAPTTTANVKILRVSSSLL